MSPQMRERCVVRAAYLEHLVARAYSTGAPPDVEPRAPRGDPAPREVEPYLSRSWPPPRFVREELGFALDCGPSIVWTMRSLVTQNARALKQLAHDAPRRVTYPKRGRA